MAVDWRTRKDAFDPTTPRELLAVHLTEDISDKVGHSRYDLNIALCAAGTGLCIGLLERRARQRCDLTA